MSFDFLNPLMLIGLAGMILPVLVHLLSRKRYDIVHWGAMQFLELGRKTRRTVRLEDLLLLLVRMGLMALLAVALARPWMAGSFLSQLASQEARDVVFIIDSSYSMGWEGQAITPHAAANQWIHDFLERLRPGDTVSLIDGRDQIRLLTETPTRNFGRIRKLLNDLPPPTAGTSRLAEAVAQAVPLLSRTSNPSREIIVLTDGQSRGWELENQALWTRYEELCEQSTIPPRIWVVSRNPWETSDRTNFSVDRLDISRERAVTGVPISVRTQVRYHGGETAVTRRVYLEIDGQRLSERTLTVPLQPETETPVEFRYRFQTPGSHRIRIVLDDDNLPEDNQAEAAVSVVDALPVLLVDGHPERDPTKSDTFFAKAALTASTNRSPWIRATVISWQDFDPTDLNGPDVVVLANVPQLSEGQAEALTNYLVRGGGLFVALGDQVDASHYNERLFAAGAGPLPAELQAIVQDSSQGEGARVINSSLEAAWMRRFRAENDGGLTDARFFRWWSVQPAAPAEDEQAADQAGEPTAQPDPPDAASREPVPATAPLVVARLNNKEQASLLLTRRFGRGGVVLMTTPLDADWSTLPARPDYVALLHEILFQLAAGQSTRNVDVGMPLVQPVAADFPVEDYQFHGPADTTLPAELRSDGFRHVVRLTDTRLPGMYTLRRRQSADENTQSSKTDYPAGAKYFVVNVDRNESDLTPLNEADRALLQQNDRMVFVESIDDLTQEMLVQNSRFELWHILLFVFLGILILEVVMTRRLLQGRGVVESAPTNPTPVR